MTSRLLLAAAALAAAPSMAATYTWGNLTPNGSLNFSDGYALATGSNWVGGSSPTFNNQAELLFTGLGASGATTVFVGNTTASLNRLTVSTSSTLRFNSGSSTFWFQGTTPTIDVQSGTLRLELMLKSSEGVTKTGTGTLFSNLQSVSSGFSGPFTIAQGLVTAGNNFALGDQKTVNISSGAALSLNGMTLASNAVTGGAVASRGYTFNIAGTGIDGSGAIYNNGAAIPTTNGMSGIRHLSLTADASIGGSNFYNIGFGGTISGNGHTLTKTGSNTVYVSGAASDISYVVSQGRLVGHADDTSLGDAVAVYGGATLASNGARSFSAALSFSDGATLENLQTTTTATWSGAVTLVGGLTNVTASSSFGQITLSGVASGDGGIRKQGANTLLMTAANTYAGQTLVTAGTLRLGASGSLANSSEIKLSAGTTFNVADVTGGYVLGSAQTLSGAGTIVGNTVIAGTHTPGFSPGLQTFSNNLTYASGANVVWELGDNSTAARGTYFDAINVQGNLAFEGPVSLTLVFDYVGGAVDWTSPFWDAAVSGTNGWKIFGVTGTVNGFANLQIANASWLDSNGIAFATARPSSQFGLHQAADGIYLTYTPVPEPSTYGLLLAGLALAGAAVRRRKTSK